jgi:5-methylcytosine-specific restriction endonuclease McrA
MVTQYTWGALPWRVRLDIKKELIARDGFCCRKCGKEMRIKGLTVDHIHSIYLGGPVTDIRNLQLLCRKCHNRKTFSEQLK